MNKRKEYLIEWRKNNKEYVEQYYQQNKEKFKLRSKINYKDNRKARRLNRIEYYNKNKDKWIKYSIKRIQQPYYKKQKKITMRRYYKKNYLKFKVRNIARYHKFRRPYCLIHLLESEYVIARDFHHTDYEINLGFSVCHKHHELADNWLKGLSK